MNKRELTGARIAELERRVAKPVDVTMVHYSAAEFFKPYFAASVIVTLVLAVPGFFMAAIAGFIYQCGQEEYANASLYIVLFIAGIFILINVIGGFISVAKSKRYNLSEENRVKADLRLRDELNRELEELKASLERDAEDNV